jgi:curli production assembly/transport component CsgG/holdfast attachment protein HfaB
MTKLIKAALLAAASSISLTACVSPVAGPNGLYAKPIGNAPVTANPTPYSRALVCMGDHARRHNLKAPRIAVGRIADYTGKEEAEGGRKVTQGASLMAITALAKAGAPLVERFDTSVSELELKYANNKLISDEKPGDYRRIHAGQVPGSDFYLVGGITELNYNIRSSGLEAFGADPDATDFKGNLGGRLFVMNVGLDLRLVETKTLEVVDVISYQKQIIAREISLGVFDFLNGNIFDISAGEGAQEPIQLAVRSLIERGVLEMTANLYGVSGPEACLGGYDPLGGSRYAGATGAYYPAYDNAGTNNGSTRAEPRRWRKLPAAPHAPVAHAPAPHVPVAHSQPAPVVRGRY